MFTIVSLLALRVFVNSLSTTHLVISWLLGRGVNATSYIISYYNTKCSTLNYDDITTRNMTYDLTGLEEGTEYSITVTAILSDDETTEENSLTTSTMPSGRTNLYYLSANHSMHTKIKFIAITATQSYTAKDGPFSTTAPSAAPTSVRVSEVTFSEITLQWEIIPCLQQNGDITGYSVRYYVGDGYTEKMTVSGGNTTEVTISGLASSSAYSVKVAGVNTGGTGVYSDPLNVTTRESEPKE